MEKYTWIYVDEYKDNVIIVECFSDSIDNARKILYDKLTDIEENLENIKEKYYEYMEEYYIMNYKKGNCLMGTSNSVIERIYSMSDDDRKIGKVIIQKVITDFLDEYFEKNGIKLINYDYFFDFPPLFTNYIIDYITNCQPSENAEKIRDHYKNGAELQLNHLVCISI
jgi:hypothetical protein